MIDTQIIMISALYPLMITLYYKLGKVEGELKRINNRRR